MAVVAVGSPASAGRCDAHARDLGGRLRSVARSVSRFRCLRCSDITREDLATSEPDPGLYARTMKAWQGKCDAFISHSWSDDEGAKWAALQQWRGAFVAEHGREPTVWLDKCCVNQHSMETDLRCLPLFLGGCKELVVLCGPSYLDRMWCVLELFMHGHMGSGPRALAVLPVLREGHLAADGLAVRRAMEEFDLKNCQCSRSEDAARITDLFMDAFGSRASFNKAVRDLMLGAEGAHGAGWPQGSNLWRKDSRPD